MFGILRRMFSSPEAGAGGTARAISPAEKETAEDELIAAADRAADALGNQTEAPPAEEATVDLFTEVADSADLYDRTMSRSPYQSRRQRENDLARLPVDSAEVSKSSQLKLARGDQAAALRRGDEHRVKALRREISQLDADRDRVKAKYQAGQAELVHKIDSGHGRAADQLRDPQKWAQAKAAESQTEKLRAGNPMYRRQSAKLTWWERTKRRFS